MKTLISSMLGLGAAVAITASAFWFGIPGEAQPVQEPATYDPAPDEDAARADLDRLEWIASYREDLIAVVGDDRCNVTVTVTDRDSGMPVLGARTDIFWMTDGPHWVPITKFPTATATDDIAGDQYTFGCFGEVYVRLASLPSDYKPVGVPAQYRQLDANRPHGAINLYAVRREREPLQQVRALVLEETSEGLEPFKGATVTFDWGERRRFKPAVGAYVLERDVRPKTTEADGRTRLTSGRGRDVIVVELDVPDDYEPVGPWKETLDYRPLSPDNDPTPSDPKLNQADKLADELEMPTFIIRKQAPGTTNHTQHEDEEHGRDDEGETPATVPATPASPPVDTVPPTTAPARPAAPTRPADSVPATRPPAPIETIPPTTQPAAPVDTVTPTNQPSAPVESIPPSTKPAAPVATVPPTTQPAPTTTVPATPPVEPESTVPATQPSVPVETVPPTTQPAEPVEVVPPSKPEVDTGGRIDQDVTERGGADEN